MNLAVDAGHSLGLWGLKAGASERTLMFTDVDALMSSADAGMEDVAHSAGAMADRAGRDSGSASEDAGGIRSDWVVPLLCNPPSPPAHSNSGSSNQG